MHAEWWVSCRVKRGLRLSYTMTDIPALVLWRRLPFILNQGKDNWQWLHLSPNVATVVVSFLKASVVNLFTEKNPCYEDNDFCNGNGDCRTYNYTEFYFGWADVYCECDEGFSGSHCEGENCRMTAESSSSIIYTRGKRTWNQQLWQFFGALTKAQGYIFIGAKAKRHRF